MCSSDLARENREIVIRLTVGMETVAKRLEQLHNDIKNDRHEIFARFAHLEQRTAKLEAKIEN